MFSEKQIEEILKSHKPKNKDDLNELIKKFSKQLIESMLESERAESSPICGVNSLML